MAGAYLCGIRVVTTHGRKFNSIAAPSHVLKTEVDVPVGSGVWLGIIQQRPPASIAHVLAAPPSRGWVQIQTPCAASALFSRRLASTTLTASRPPTVHVPLTFPRLSSGFLRLAKKPTSKVTAFRKELGRATKLVRRLKPFLLGCIPAAWLTVFSALRILILHVLLPLYDLISDGIAAYYYYDDEERILSGVIVFFVCLPHLVHGAIAILEMIVNEGEFDDYPGVIVAFYTYRPERCRLLVHVLKFLTLPFFAVLHFLWFFKNMIAYAVRVVGKMLIMIGFGFVGIVGQRHSESIRQDNVKDDRWAKTVLIELLFETIPQIVTQASAFVSLYETDNSLRTYAIVSSIVVSILHFAHHCWVLNGFMRRTSMTLFNTFRILLSSSLDFFPMFSLYKEAAEFVLFRFYDNPVLLQLWGPLRKILMTQSSLRQLVLYIEDTKEWLEMSLQLMDAISVNEKAALEHVDVCVEASTTEEAQKVGAKLGAFKSKFYDLLGKKRTEKVFLLIDAAVDVGIVSGSIEEQRDDSVEVDGFRWSWQWPPGKTARIEYCIQRID